MTKCNGTWCGIIAINLGTPSLEANAGGTEGSTKGRVASPREKWLAGRNFILHTDSAKSYKATVLGVHHERVIQEKQRAKVGTKFHWIAPKYVMIKCHKVPVKKIMKAKFGTQIIDRCW